MIKAMLIIAAGLYALPALAGDIGRMLETSEEARQRQGAEAWQSYEQRRYLPPLGGYRERLGDPWQPGAERPGYRRDDDHTMDGIGGGWPSSRKESY